MVFCSPTTGMCVCMCACICMFVHVQNVYVCMFVGGGTCIMYVSVYIVYCVCSVYIV